MAGSTFALRRSTLDFCLGGQRSSTPTLPRVRRTTLGAQRLATSCFLLFAFCLGLTVRFILRGLGVPQVTLGDPCLAQARLRFGAAASCAPRPCVFNKDPERLKGLGFRVGFRVYGLGFRVVRVHLFPCRRCLDRHWIVALRLLDRPLPQRLARPTLP